jgi:hypothetical protein
MNVALTLFYYCEKIDILSPLLRLIGLETYGSSLPVEFQYSKQTEKIQRNRRFERESEKLLTSLETNGHSTTEIASAVPVRGKKAHRMT